MVSERLARAGNLHDGASVYSLTRTLNAMRPNTYLFLLIVVLAICLAPAYAQDRPPALVVTEPLSMMDFHEQLTLIGRTTAQAESRIVAEVEGRVQRIDAAEGRRISAGTALVSIDPRRIELALRAKQAEAEQARADAEFARRDLERAEESYDQKILPERTLDTARAAAKRTQERFNQLEAERAQLELDLEKCTIRAPFDGYTIQYLVQIGEWVNRGTPVYEVVDLSVVKITVDLPERHFSHVEIGSPVSITISGDDDRPVEGKVAGIAPLASQATHTFPVIVHVKNKEGRLGSGMLVKATLSLKDEFSSLAVSKDAIIRQGDQTMVYTIVDGKAQPIPVRTTSSHGTMVAVQGDGLQEGMPVVVRGNERIFPGSPVQTPDGGGQSDESAAQGQTSGR